MSSLGRTECLGSCLEILCGVRNEGAEHGCGGCKIEEAPSPSPPQRSYRSDGGQVPHQTSSSESRNWAGGEKWMAVTVFHPKH